MNIVFIAPPEKKEKASPSYKAIIDAAKKLKHTINKDYLTASGSAQSSKLSADQLQKKHQKMIELIKEADVVIAEASSLTVEISRLVSVALQAHIPVLVLYKNKSPQAFVFETSRLMTMEKYSPETVKEVLSQYLKQAEKKKLRYRFNLMLSKELGSFVMEKSQEYNVSKADYIRKLIQGEMKKN